MTQLNEKTFNANLILTELSRHFRDVKFVRFMRYFGFDHSKGNRVLVRCSDKRPESGLLSVLDDTDSLDYQIAGVGGQRQAHLLQGRAGLMIAKAVGTGPFGRLDGAMQSALFDQISARSPKCLVLPMKVMGKYATPSGGRHWRIFPYVGDMVASHGTEEKLTPAEILRTCRRVSLELNVVDKALLNDQNVRCMWLSLSEDRHLPAGLISRISEIVDVTKILMKTHNYRPADTVCLVHHDLHAGNMIRDHGEIRVIDLDSMQLGVVCSDIVRAAIWYNCTRELIASEISEFESALGRHIEASEFAYSIGLWVAWFSDQEARGESRSIEKYQKGLKNVAGYFYERWGD
jgi:hypothetical protein